MKTMMSCAELALMHLLKSSRSLITGFKKSQKRALLSVFKVEEFTMYIPAWQENMITSSFERSKETFSTYKKLLRMGQLLGSLPVQEINSIGTEKQREKVQLTKSSFLFFYALFVPLLPICYMFYELTASPLVDEIKDQVEEASGKAFWHGQTEAFTFLVGCLIPTQVFLECYYGLFKLVGYYPELLLQFLPVCR